MEKSGSYIMTSLRKTILDFSCNSSGRPFDPGTFNLRSGVIFFFSFFGWRGKNNTVKPLLSGHLY